MDQKGKKKVTKKDPSVKTLSSDTSNVKTRATLGKASNKVKKKALDEPTKQVPEKTPVPEKVLVEQHQCWERL